MDKGNEIGVIKIYENPDNHMAHCSIELKKTNCLKDFEDYAIKAIMGVVIIYVNSLKSIRNDLEKSNAEMDELANFSLFVNDRKEKFIEGFTEFCNDFFANADPLAGSPEWVKEMIREGIRGDEKK